jgi:GH15 family glucan-1,4-alpha-glucosidase
MSEYAPAIEDYALIGDGQSAALVSLSGSIDWLCWPRFDSGACFAALLGTAANGRWRIAPDLSADCAPARVRRYYRPGTMILCTEFDTETGRATVTDFMPLEAGNSSVVRIVEGVAGRVAMRLDLALRFDYGDAVPWVTRLPDGSGLRAIAGPDMVVLRTPVALHGEGLSTVAEFTVEQGQSVPFVLSYGASHQMPPVAIDAHHALRGTETIWTRWSARCTYQGPYAEAVSRSALVLKALIYAPTGGIVAAPTTSLPEQLGGSRNWDYRYCWLRDATFSLIALLEAGFREEAHAWRMWLQRAIAGSPAQMSIMYGLGGERRMPEWEVPWLPGYQGARPVRVGNAAAQQFQLDVYGEVIDALYRARQVGLIADEPGWNMQRTLVNHVAKVWNAPDEGIWEVRGGRRHFTHSKVMAWVAMDRAIRNAETFGREAPVGEWKRVRARIHAAVCAEGFNTRRNSFVQSFGGNAVDASLLLLPLVGFLPADDPRIVGTVAAIERELMLDGHVLRYHDDAAPDGLPAGEGTFLLCGFWLADNYILQGRMEEAHALFERLLAVRNDVGLLAEEYDPRTRRMTGNFPQAFSHVGLIVTALSLTPHGPVELRGAS